MLKTEIVSSEELAVLAAHAAAEAKAGRVRVLHVGKLCGYAEYFVLASCDNRSQMRAVAAKVAEGARGLSRHRVGVEGESSDRWMLIDYGDVVVHLFHPETRQYFNLDKLWADAPELDWESIDINKQA